MINWFNSACALDHVLQVKQRNVSFGLLVQVSFILAVLRCDDGNAGLCATKQH